MAPALAIAISHGTGKKISRNFAKNYAVMSS